MRPSASIFFAFPWMLVPAVLFSASLLAQQTLHDDLYHPYVELALSGEELEGALVEKEDLERVVDRLLKLGEFGALIHLLADRDQELSPLLRFVHGTLLEESGDPEGAYKVLFPLYNDLSKSKKDFLSDPAFYHLSRKSVSIGYAYVRRRPIIHIPSGLDVFSGPDGEALLPKVTTHLTRVILWTKGACLEGHPNISTPSRNSPELVDWADSNPDAHLLQGIAIRLSEGVDADWLDDAAKRFEESDPELALVALSRLAENEGLERITLDRVVELSDRLTSPSGDSLNALIKLTKWLPALAPQVEETFVKCKQGNFFLSSSQIRIALVTCKEINLSPIVSASLDHRESIDYWKRVSFKIPGDPLWVGSEEALRENGLDASLVGLLRDEKLKDYLDDELRSIDHPAWQFAVGRFEKDEALSSALAERLAAGSSRQRYLAATWFEETGDWEQALALFSGLDEDSEEASILKLTLLVEFCFRHSDKDRCLEELKSSIRRLQFYILPEKQECRLVDVAFATGMEAEVIIDKNRYRGFRGWSHPDPLVGRDQALRTARFARLSTLECLTAEGLFFSFGKRANRIQVPAGGKRSIDQKTRSEEARHSAGELLNGGGSSTRSSFRNLASSYPRKTTFLVRWIDSCVLDEAGGPTLARYLERNPIQREEIFEEVDQSASSRIAFYGSLAKGLHHIHDEGLRAELTDKVLSVARAEIDRSEGGLGPGPGAPDPFADHREQKSVGLAAFLETLLYSPEVSASAWYRLVLAGEERDSDSPHSLAEVLRQIEDLCLQAEEHKTPPLLRQLPENQMFFFLVRLMLESDRDGVELVKAAAPRLFNLGIERPVGNLLVFTSAAETGWQSLRDFTLGLLQKNRFPPSAVNALFELRPHESWNELWNPEAFIVEAFLSEDDQHVSFSERLIIQRVEENIDAGRSDEAWAMVDDLVPEILSDFDVEKRQNITPKLKRIGQELFPVLARDPNLFDELSDAFRDDRFEFSATQNYYGMHQSFVFDGANPGGDLPISSSEIAVGYAELLTSRFHLDPKNLETFGLPSKADNWTVQESCFAVAAESLGRLLLRRPKIHPTDEVREKWSQSFGGRLLLSAWDETSEKDWPVIFLENLPEIQSLSDEKQLELASLLASGDFEYTEDDIPSWVRKVHRNYWSTPAEDPKWKSISDDSRLGEVSRLFLEAGDLDSFRWIYKELVQRSNGSMALYRSIDLFRPSEHLPALQRALLLLSVPEINYIKDWPDSGLTPQAFYVERDCIEWIRQPPVPVGQQSKSTAQSLADFILEAEASIPSERRQHGYLLLFSKRFLSALQDQMRIEAQILVEKKSPDAPDWTREFLLSTEPVEFDHVAFLSKIDDPHLRLLHAESLFSRNGGLAETRAQQEILRIGVDSIAEMSLLLLPELNRIYRGEESWPWPENFLFNLDDENAFFEDREELIDTLLDSWVRPLERIIAAENPLSFSYGMTTGLLLATAIQRDRVDIIDAILHLRNLKDIVYVRPLALQLIEKGHLDHVRDKVPLKYRFGARKLFPRKHFSRFKYGLVLKPSILNFCETLEDAEVALQTEIRFATDSRILQQIELPVRRLTDADEEEYLKWFRSLYKRVLEFPFEDPKAQYECVEMLRKDSTLTDEEKDVLNDLHELGKVPSKSQAPRP